MSGALLQARGLRWKVGATPIVDGIDLSVDRGRARRRDRPQRRGQDDAPAPPCRLLAPNAGTCSSTAAALPSLDARARARRLAFMSQETAQSFPFTVMEILLMGRYPHLGRFEPESQEDREKARRILSYVGLAGLEERCSASSPEGSGSSCSSRRPSCRTPKRSCWTSPAPAWTSGTRTGSSPWRRSWPGRIEP